MELKEYLGKNAEGKATAKDLPLSIKQLLKESLEMLPEVYYQNRVECAKAIKYLRNKKCNQMFSYAKKWVNLETDLTKYNFIFSSSPEGIKLTIRVWMQFDWYTMNLKEIVNPEDSLKSYEVVGFWVPEMKQQIEARVKSMIN